MNGTCELTGRFLSGEAYYRQAVRRAIRTPKRSMIMNRWFGVDILKMLDQSLTGEFLLDVTSEISEVLEKTIPELEALVEVESVSEENTSFTISGKIEGRSVRFEGI